MPWTIQKDGDNWCVHKQNEDGSAGEKVKCHPTEDAAKEHLKALYANADGKEKMQSMLSSLFATLKGVLHLNLGNKSLEEKVDAIRSQFYRTFEQLYEPEPGAYVREVFDDHVIVQQGDKMFKVNYSIEADGKVSFAPRDQWQEVEQRYVAMQSGFSFTELSAGDLVDPVGLKYIDGLAAGTFISMTGEEVTFAPEELPLYIENTMKVIESTRTEGGEIVGLPIDPDGHNHKGGAGWIVGLELDEARNVIRFLVNWTNEGIELIKNNIRRFFSPSTDPTNKVILGGSLTNWPATRLETGQILLRPVELSQSIKEIDMSKTLEQMFAEFKTSLLEAVGRKPAELQADPPAAPAATAAANEQQEAVSPSLKELLRTPEAVEELGKRAAELAQEAIRTEKRKLHAVNFAARIVGGTKDRPYGLKAKPEEIVALLLSLPEKQAMAVEKLMEQMLESAIDFSEHGFDTEGFIQKPQLPADIKPYARQWVDAGKPIAEFFRQNPELGPMENYNLSEFTKEK